MPVSRRTRVLTGVAVVTVVGAVGAGLLARARLNTPLVSETDLHRAEELTSAALLDAHTGRCPRAVLRGEPTPGDGTGEVAALLGSHGPFVSCFAELPAGVEGLDEALRGCPSDAALAVGLSVEPLPTSTPRGVAILERCAGLDDYVVSALQHGSVCTADPLGVAWSGEAGRDFFRGFRTVQVLLLSAASRIRRGELRSGVELLLDAVRFAQDFQRGRPEMIGVFVARGMMARALKHIEAVMALDLPWTRSDLTALTEQAERLSVDREPVLWIIDDGYVSTMHALRRRGWDVPTSLVGAIGPPDDEWFATAPRSGFDAVEFTIAHQLASQDLALVCRDPGASRSDCDTALARDGIAATVALAAVHESGLAEIDPVSRGRRELLALRAKGIPRVASLLRDVVRQEALVRALPALFVHRRLALGGTCPTADEMERMLATVPMSGGLGGEHRIADGYPGALRVWVPEWLVPGDDQADSSGLDLVCPALPSAWPPAVGQEP